MLLETALIGTVIVIGLALVYLDKRRRRSYEDYIKRKRVPECGEPAERVFEIINGSLWYGANKQMLVSVLGDENEVEAAIDELLRAGRIKENTATVPDGRTVLVPNWYVVKCDLKD